MRHINFYLPENHLLELKDATEHLSVLAEHSSMQLGRPLTLTRVCINHSLYAELCDVSGLRESFTATSSLQPELECMHINAAYAGDMYCGHYKWFFIVNMFTFTRFHCTPFQQFHVVLYSFV